MPGYGFSGAAGLLTAAAVASAVYALVLSGDASLVGGRLERLSDPVGEAAAPVPTGPAPAWGRLLIRMRQGLPESFLRRLWAPEIEAAAALSASGLQPTDVHLAGALLALTGVLVLATLSLVRVDTPPGWALLLVGGAGVLGPRLWLKGAVGRHQAAVSRELPKVAELLTLGAESGLELLEAIRMASSLSTGPVGLALGEALAEIDAGRETLVALRGVAVRVGGQVARAFVAAVTQGLELGSPVARVLRVQADTLRSKRRQALEAQVAGVPMKLTLITVLLFVPALLVLSVVPNLLAFLRGGW